MRMPLNPFDGPIPGANYTSDTKNYPWHRPPEVSDLDDAIELFSKRITNEDVLPKVITMMEIGLPVVRIAEIAERTAIVFLIVFVCQFHTLCRFHQLFSMFSF